MFPSKQMVYEATCVSNAPTWSLDNRQRLVVEQGDFISHKQQVEVAT